MAIKLTVRNDLSSEAYLSSLPKKMKDRSLEWSRLFFSVDLSSHIGFVGHLPGRPAEALGDQIDRVIVLAGFTTGEGQLADLAENDNQ